MDKIKERLLMHFKTQARLAKALGISEASVSRWGYSDGKIPEVHRFKIELITKGEFPYAELSKMNWKQR